MDRSSETGTNERDLKPANLFLPAGDLQRVKLLDFGIARRQGATRPMTRTGTVIGTPEYMAPEQARGLRELTPAADIFSLGCVLFECLTGRPPFLGSDNMALLAKILCEEPIPLRIVRPELPAELEQLVARMLAKVASRRPQDAQALLGELSQLAPFRPDGESTTTALSYANPAVSHGELRIACVVFAARRSARPWPPTGR